MKLIMRHIHEAAIENENYQMVKLSQHVPIP